MHARCQSEWESMYTECVICRTPHIRSALADASSDLDRDTLILDDGADDNEDAPTACMDRCC